MNRRFPPNISRRELEFSQTATRRGIDNTIPEHKLNDAIRTAEWLQALRDKVNGLPGKKTRFVMVSSGYRCPKLNRAIGGSKTSAHMRACGADFHVTGMKLDEVYSFIIRSMEQTHPYDQLIYEFGRWIHVGFAEEGKPQRKEKLVAKKKRNRWGRMRTVYSYAKKGVDYV